MVVVQVVGEVTHTLFAINYVSIAIAVWPLLLFVLVITIVGKAAER